ncbi:MAG: hypothetical protein FWG66_02660 [Spirochaetes bacterium]|nr:hypothetical protein [Spirochaetota bacterium]
MEAQEGERGESFELSGKQRDNAAYLVKLDAAIEDAMEAMIKSHRGFNHCFLPVFCAMK